MPCNRDGGAVVGIQRFTDSVRCGFDTLDEDGHLKRSTVMRFVMGSYGRTMEVWEAASRGEYLAKHAVSPITAHIELTCKPARLHIDQPLEVRAASVYGFVPGGDDAPPRYGGTDRFDVVDGDDTVVAVWRQHWFWHRPETGQLLHEPAPGVPVGQDQPVEPPPRRPRLDQPEARRWFRWTVRETDANRHINVLGYLERAENAIADADGLDLDAAGDAHLWFRRPTFLADAMVADVGWGEDALLVELRRAEHDELCATLAFSS